MTRRDIVLQILSEAAASSKEDAEVLLEAMIAEEMISDSGLEEEFSSKESERLIGEFRAELPGIRRWLSETGLMDICGHG
jgi:hypothetical protein